MALQLRFTAPVLGFAAGPLHIRAAHLTHCDHIFYAQAVFASVRYRTEHLGTTRSDYSALSRRVRERAHPAAGDRIRP